jgi:hypothetical protein
MLRVTGYPLGTGSQRLNLDPLWTGADSRLPSSVQLLLASTSVEVEMS